MLPVLAVFFGQLLGQGDADGTHRDMHCASWKVVQHTSRMQNSRFNSVIVSQHGDDGFSVFYRLAC